MDEQRSELDRLTDENLQLQKALKRSERSVKMLEAQIERNRVAFEAKDNLRQALEASRSELERYMNLLLVNGPDIIFLLDSDTRLAYCTEEYLRLCGIPAFGMVRGLHARDLIRDYASESLIAELDAIYERLAESEQTVVLHGSLDFKKTGNARHYNIQITPMLKGEGVLEGSIIILSDMTEIRNAQQEAIRANAAKSDFLATVSHEIRTPMNAIIGVSSMLKSTGLDETQHRYIKNIQDSSHVLLNLIDDILDFSKIESGKLEILPDYFRLRDMIKHLHTMFDMMFRQKSIELRFEVSDTLSAVVYGDDKRVRQVLTNLLNNALKYTEKGTVVFSADVDAFGMLEFKVSDTGIGIKEDVIPRLFSAFERFDQNRNKGIVGTGLGLAITKRLCSLMDGTIEVSSVYGEGSTFTARLPLATGSEGDVRSEERREAFSFTAPRARVLLVDDIDINLQVAAFMLGGFDISPDFATNGRQAVIMTQSGNYDIIFMDHMMPEMDGIEATQLIRALPGKAAETPVIALTANAVSSARDNFIANGFNGFLSKPMDDAALADCLLEWLPEELIEKK